MPPFAIALQLAQFAPSVMRWLGAGQESTNVATSLVNMATSMTGATTPEEAIAKLNDDPKLSHEYQLAVLQATTSLEAAYLADVQNARARDIEYVRAGRHNTRADLMVLAAVVGLIACLVCLVFFKGQLSEGANTIITSVASIFGLCLRDAFTFEFGSSRGSKDKDELLSQRAAGGQK